MTDLLDNDLMGTTVNTEDPAAEFLAQQQDEIAGLESDVLGGFTEINAESPPAMNGTMENMFGDNVMESNDNLNDGSFENIVNDQGDAGGGDFEQLDPSQAYAAIAAADARLEQLRSEPEKIRQWREENTQLLAEKDRESEKKQQEWLAQARKELEEWDRNRQEQLDKTKEGNRTAEAQFVKDRDHHATGSEWERVSKLCDFNPKVSKGSKDVTRMRSSLLHLKQKPKAVSVPDGE